jgi:hypothetical protein
MNELREITRAIDWQAEKHMGDTVSQAGRKEMKKLR